MIKKISYVMIGIVVFACFVLGWSYFIHRLHREKGGSWENAGVACDYVEWKITREKRGRERFIHETSVIPVWRANFRNITDKTKRIWITFELLDRDNFVIGGDTKGTYDAIYLSPKEEKVIDGEFEIDNHRALSAFKSRLKLSAKDTVEKVELYKWEEMANWSKLQEDMTQPQVREILGEPQVIEKEPTYTSRSIKWSYPNGGTVTFIEKTSNKVYKVIFWDEPTWKMY
jgi:hypothetical protein